MSSTSILHKFNEYKQFCLTQIASPIIEESAKFVFMNKVIDNLMEQNELLLKLLAEAQQSAQDRSEQMHALLKKTAAGSCKVGTALSSYELEVKRFTQQSIPSFLKCVQLAQQIQSQVENLKKENLELKIQNENFLSETRNHNTDLCQYRHMVYNIKSHEQLDSSCYHPTRIDSENQYLDMVLKNKLRETSDNITTMVCASALDQIILAVELNIEQDNENNSTSLTCLSNTKRLATETPDSHWCDINDNYEDNVLDEIYLECIKHGKINSHDDIQCWPNEALTFLNIICNELELKHTVIMNLKLQLDLIKQQYLSLQNRHFELITYMLDIFAMSDNANGQHNNLNDNWQTILDKIKYELEQPWCSYSNKFAWLQSHNHENFRKKLAKCAPS